MAKRVDNDRTKNLATPFLILAHVRTGGTLLAHALSNHPQVYCDRGETLHHLSAWRLADVPAETVLRVIWNQDGYHAAGFRAIYRQAFHPQVWSLIQRVQPRVIHLTRHNVARQGVSFGYQQLVRRGELPFHPVHTFEPCRLEPVRVKPQMIVDYAIQVRNQVRRGRAVMAKYPGPVLDVTYEELTQGQDVDRLDSGATKRIGEFLGIRSSTLAVDLRRVFDCPMAGWFTNWPDIRAGLEAAGFEGVDG